MITVVNKHHGQVGEYIGRGNPLGNPYSHMPGTKAEFIVLTREDAIREYRNWLIYKVRLKDPKILAELQRLLELAKRGDLNLQCFCHPKPCHGDVVKEFLEAQMKKDEEAMRETHMLVQDAVEEKKNMVFVFGSNLQGRHGAGAAYTAYKHHGAIPGKGIGHFGNSYALPTCGNWNGKYFPGLPFTDIRFYVAEFLEYARKHPELQFQVTRVGCGLAGFRDIEMAPLFNDAPDNCLFDTLWKAYLPGKKFWGTF